VVNAFHARGGRFLISTLVSGKFHGHLLYLRGPAAAREVLARLLADDTHEWLAVSVGEP
jgi:hypothetical protein